MFSSSSASTKTPYTKFLEGLVYTYTFPIPQARHYTSDYLAAFKTYSKTNPDTLQLMEDLTNHRIKFLTETSSNGPIPEQLAALELYLQAVHSLHESLTIALDARQNVACDRDIAFEWTLYLNNRTPFRSSSLVFEMIMLYHVKAMLHYRSAQQLLNTDYASCASDAGKQFLQAASVYEFLHTNIGNTKWDRKFHPKEPNPPECSALVCAAMALYCRERAQATALVKGLVENKISAMVKTRLSLGVSVLAAQCMDQLLQSQPNYVKREAWVYLPFYATIGADREVFRGLAQHFLALHCAEDTVTASVGGRQLGQALSCTAQAKLFLQEQRFPFYEPQNPGLPKISQFPYTGLTHLRDISVYLQMQWDETAPVWDRENRMIYFQPQPRAMEEYVIPTPSEAIVANPPRFTEPEPRIIAFIDPPKPVSVFSSFFGSLSGSKSNIKTNNNNNNNENETASSSTPAVNGDQLLSASMLTGNDVPEFETAAAGRELTDEEFARELQRRLNAPSAADATHSSGATPAPAPSAPPAATHLR